MNILDKKYTDFLILREEKLKEEVKILRNLSKKDILKKIKRKNLISQNILIKKIITYKFINLY